MNKPRRVTFQDKWFQHWFVRKGRILHERFIDYGWVLQHLNLTRGNILDVGCGASFFPLLLAVLGFNVTATDAHPYRYGYPQYKFVLGDAATVKLDAQFDRIISMSALEHFGVQLGKDLDYDRKAVKHLSQYLKLDGQWLITVPFGKHVVLRGWRVYDQTRLDSLFPNIVKQDYFLREGVEPYFKKVPFEEVEMIRHKRGRPPSASTCLVANKRD